MNKVCYPSMVIQRRALADEHQTLLSPAVARPSPSPSPSPTSVSSSLPLLVLNLRGGRRCLYLRLCEILTKMGMSFLSSWQIL
jgi:hypothetical protein